ncbi:MAG: hypothetical protein Fur0025_29580 [Oscillatoriaceae cyanobacterium]
MYWQPGQKLKTRPYQIETIIGEGGFGVTYKARHLDLQHQVVLKTPKPENGPARKEYQRFKERFIKEGQILAQVSEQAHPSIVRVSDLFEEDDIPCLVMDFVPGSSLYDLVEEGGPLPETQAVEYIRQIAEGLILCHEMGIVHRDAHALNIIVANQNRAVLIDFGIAGDIVPIVSTMRLGWNRAFAPYEQMLGGSGLPTVDVYTLGASLYYAVTGQLPTPAAKRKLNNQALIPPKQHNPQISDGLDAAIIQAMALEPTDRPQTIRDFLALLQPNQQLVGTRDALSLRGYFILPELTAQGMVRRLGRGKILEVIALKQELTIVIACGGATLFNLRTGEALWEIDCPASSGAVSADGRMLALGENRDIYLWDLTTGQFLRQLTGHTSWVISVSFSPDGKYLASGSWDYTVRLWDVATGRSLRQLTRHIRNVTSVSFSPDGKTLASGSTDKTVRLWDMATGQQLRQLTGHKKDVYRVSFSPDGKYLASGSTDKTVRLWNVATGQELRQLTGHTESVSSVSFSPDGQTLASGSSDNTVQLWDVTTGRELLQFTGHIERVSSVSFSPDGKYLVSGSGDKTVRLWDVAKGRELRQLTGHTHWVYSVSFNPDGQILASGGLDKTVRLWDVATGRSLRQLQGHTDSVTSVSFNPDGKYLASAGDSVVRLWRL